MLVEVEDKITIGQETFNNWAGKFLMQRRKEQATSNDV